MELGGGLEEGSLASQTNSATLAGLEARIVASSGLGESSLLSFSPEEVEVDHKS